MDWIAGILELSGDWTIGNKKKFGFILKFLCNLAWIYVALTTKVYGLLIVVVPAVFVNIRNYTKWAKENKNAGKVLQIN